MSGRRICGGALREWPGGCAADLQVPRLPGGPADGGCLPPPPRKDTPDLQSEALGYKRLQRRIAEVLGRFPGEGVSRMLVDALRNDLVPHLSSQGIAQHYATVLASMERQGVDGCDSFAATYAAELKLTAPSEVFRDVWSQAVCHRLWRAEALRSVASAGITLPISSLVYGPYRGRPYEELFRLLSWTYCPGCGLRSADGRLLTLCTSPYASETLPSKES